MQWAAKISCFLCPLPAAHCTLLMDTTITLSSIGAIIGILVLFIILKRVVGLVFRLIMAGVLIVAVIVGAWWWSKSDDAPANDDARPRRTQRSTQGK